MFERLTCNFDFYPRVSAVLLPILNIIPSRCNDFNTRSFHAVIPESQLFVYADNLRRE